MGVTAVAVVAGTARAAVAPATTAPRSTVLDTLPTDMNMGIDMNSFMYRFSPSR